MNDTDAWACLKAILWSGDTVLHFAHWCESKMSDILSICKGFTFLPGKLKSGGRQMWQIFVKGGIVMIPLALCSLTGLFIIVERILFFSRTSRQDERETGLLKLYLSQGKMNEAKLLIAKWDSPLARMTETGLRQYETDKGRLEIALESVGQLEVKSFQRGLGILDTIVTASPLLGLLGTVTGIIRSFAGLSLTGAAQSLQLSLGIAEALYNTAFGLSIAIPCLFFVNYFYNIAEKRTLSLNRESQEILALLQKG
jgi:biopolymer transport protein ExbB